MLPDDSPIGRDVKTETSDPFGNITSNPSMANLMADPLGTELVAGLTGPISAQSLPTDEEDVMGQPPQVNFDGGGGGATDGPSTLGTTLDGTFDAEPASPASPAARGAQACSSSAASTCCPHSPPCRGRTSTR